MKIRSSAVGLALGILACAADPVEQFNEDRIEAICAWHERCGSLEVSGFEDIGDCRSGLAAAARSERSNMNCDGFDEEAADACVAAWGAGDCEVPPDLSGCEGVCED